MPLHKNTHTLKQTSGTQLIADIEQRLVQVQERQRKESQEQIRSQAGVQSDSTEEAGRAGRETSAGKVELGTDSLNWASNELSFCLFLSCLQSIQEQFAQQRDLLLKQLEEQRKVMEEDRKKRRRVSAEHD